MRSLLISFYDITYFLIVVFIFVSWMLIQIFLNFSFKPKNFYYNSFYYLNSRLIPYNHSFLELIWTITPIIIFILIFCPVLKLVRVLGFEDTFVVGNTYKKILNVYNVDQDPIYTVKVIGNQWYWMYESSKDFIDLENINDYYDDEILFSYYSFETFNSIGEENLKNFDQDFKMRKYIRLLSTDCNLSVISDNLISFFITSYDVIHCWSIPSSGIKVDACPGRISSSKVFFKEKGFFYGQCSELCGFLHGFMPISLRVY